MDTESLYALLDKILVPQSLYDLGRLIVILIEKAARRFRVQKRDMVTKKMACSC